MIAGAKGRAGRVSVMLRRLARGLLALAPAALAGCYSYVPVESAPTPGVGMEVELNDLGRVEMARTIGPSVVSIEGVLESRSDTAFVVRVMQIVGEDGRATRWEGEQVTIRPAYVEQMGTRRFSVGRTVVASAMAGAGFLAVVMSLNLNGQGGTPSSAGNGNNGSK
ncbi:MAG TPA: hypothetical protein VMT21_01300 [Gemmatimonadales bacterium]|nr:hypothetical protein [Gemmatimonadales bacterium]